MQLTAAHQTRLTTLAVRTMSLPVGRGAFTLGTLRLLPTDPFTIPPLCMAGRLPEKQNATINLDLSSAAPAGGACTDVTAWPEFHNGAAAGEPHHQPPLPLVRPSWLNPAASVLLRFRRCPSIACHCSLPEYNAKPRSRSTFCNLLRSSGLSMSPGGTRLTRTWIVYNKPSQPNYTHAGTLMALGLMGNLGCLSAADLFTYLSQVDPRLPSLPFPSGLSRIPCSGHSSASSASCFPITR